MKHLDLMAISEIRKIDPRELRPKDTDSKKAMLKEVVTDLEYLFIASRKNKPPNTARYYGHRARPCQGEGHDI